MDLFRASFGLISGKWFRESRGQPERARAFPQYIKIIRTMFKFCGTICKISGTIYKLSRTILKKADQIESGSSFLTSQLPEDGRKPSKGQKELLRACQKELGLLDGSMASYSKDFLEDHHRALFNQRETNSLDIQYASLVVTWHQGMRIPGFRGLLYWFTGIYFLDVQQSGVLFTDFPLVFFLATSDVMMFWGMFRLDSDRYPDISRYPISQYFETAHSNKLYIFLTAYTDTDTAYYFTMIHIISFLIYILSLYHVYFFII